MGVYIYVYVHPVYMLSDGEEKRNLLSEADTTMRVDVFGGSQEPAVPR